MATKCHSKCCCSYYQDKIIELEIYRGLEISCVDGRCWGDTPTVTFMFNNKEIISFDENDETGTFHHLLVWRNTMSATTNIDPHAKRRKQYVRKTK